MIEQHLTSTSSFSSFQSFIEVVSILDVLATLQWELDDLQEKVIDRDKGWDTGHKWKENDVEPCHKICKPPVQGGEREEWIHMGCVHNIELRHPHTKCDYVSI